MNTFLRYAALVAVSCIVAACASPPATIPPYLAFSLAKANIGEAASIRYEDQAGHPISEEEFAAQYEKTRRFAMTKAYKGSLPDLTLRIASSAELEEPGASGTPSRSHQRLPATHAVVDFQTCPRPVYPASEVRQHHTGTVSMSFLVTTEGYVRKAEITASSGYPLLDQAAMVSLVRCRFKPAMVDGVAKEGWSPVKYVWSIQ